MTDESQFLLVILGVLVALVALVGGAVSARRRFLVVSVAGDSMVPSLVHGDRLLVRRTHRFRAGDIVVAHHQEGGPRAAAPGSGASDWLVKRVVALPGDQVPQAVVPVVGDQVRRVPAGMTVLLGDNSGSVDSRRWGFVPVRDIEGVMVRRLASGGS
ncbi:S26 family signal peptidase [Micromonospora sp. NPDC005172]|uniref:S26 family signal peptidase n=1 Tax=Micromonospora sp. NPDC005172 TaxID=3156867 RepID=UPI0033BECB95